MASPQIESGKYDKASGSPPAARLPDFVKLLEELKALKTRSYSLDLQRLEESQKAELEAVMKAAEKRTKIGADLLKAQAEERRIAEAKHQHDKEMLAAKFQKLDQSLLALGHFLQTTGPLRDLEARLAEREAELRKQEEELNVQRKVFARERDELEAEKGLLQAAEEMLKERQRQLELKLANLDVVNRAVELDQLQLDLDGKVKAFAEQEALLEKQREELNRDFDKLGEARADIDRVVEGLETERAALTKQKNQIADTVAREMAATFESFVRDMLRENAKAAPTAAPAPAPAAKPAAAKPSTTGATPSPRKAQSGANPWADLPT